MKKLIIVLTLSLLLTNDALAVTTLPAANTGSAAANRTTVKTSVEANLTENLRTRAKTEITRRLDFLSGLLTKLSNIKKISDSDKASFQTQIQTQIDGLNSLQTKIDADTDITTLRTDVKSIISDYYIFAFFRVKINLLFAADRLSTTADSLSALSLKLKTRLDEASANGKDVTSFNTLLTDMNSKVSDAQTQYQAVEEELNGLDAKGYPGNRTTLLDARTKVKAGVLDMKTAYQDALKIRQGLGDLKVKANATSETETATPTASQ